MICRKDATQQEKTGDFYAGGGREPGIWLERRADNVGGVKDVSSTRRHALGTRAPFRSHGKKADPTTARLVILSGQNSV